MCIQFFLDLKKYHTQHHNRNNAGIGLRKTSMLNVILSPKNATQQKKFLNSNNSK